MTEVQPPDFDQQPRYEKPPGPSTGRRVALAMGGLVVVLVLGLWAFLNFRSPGQNTPAPTTSAPTADSPASTKTPQPTSVAPVVPPEAVTAVWPTAATTVRYPSPQAAARGFATELAGFTDPLVGPFQAGDAQSGEVEVRPAADGPVTTVFARRFGDGTWWVLGAATAGIELASPTAGEAVGSPVRLTGRAFTFEGHVTVRIVSDAGGAPLATGFVTGGGDELRPFEGTFPLAGRTGTAGAVILTTESAADGRVWSASVLRVRFAS